MKDTEAGNAGNDLGDKKKIKESTELRTAEGEGCLSRRNWRTWVLGQKPMGRSKREWRERERDI